MVSHQRLQHYRANYCLLCMTGLLGCRWHRYKQSTRDSRKRDLLSFTVLLVTFLYVLFYFYFWLVAANDQDDLNWYLYEMVAKWYPWYKVGLALSCVIFIYYAVLMILTLLHVIQGHQLYIYPVHLVVSVITLACCITATVIFDNLWHSEWTVVKQSLQITGPFLHIGVVALVTLMTWIIAGQWLQLSYKVVKCVWLTVYICIVVLLYLSPLIINSPCVVALRDLPPKPKVIGHRGAPAVAPENTMLSFQLAAEKNVWAFESDVRISYDGVPFLFHDRTMRRTTDISTRLPLLVDFDVSFFNITQLQAFDAGSWFLAADPFDTVNSLSETERRRITQQKIPKFADLLQFAKDADKYVIFDVFGPPSEHPYVNSTMEIVVSAILESGIDQKNILWISGQLPQRGENFSLTANSYLSPDELRRQNYSAVNFQYGMMSVDGIRQLNEENITTNIYTVNSAWFFSLYWCVGAQSVSSDRCDLFDHIDRPVWHLSPQSYLILWISVDVLSAVIIVVLFIVQRVRLYGTKFNPETLSLQSGRTDNSYDEMYKSKNMKQRLLRNGDPFEVALDQSNGSLNSAELPVGSYCLHTMNGSSPVTPSTDAAPVTNTPVISHTEIRADLS